MLPGEFLFDGDDLELNANRPVVTITVNNTGDRPVQVGSHYHFFEVNRGLVFDRTKAYGMRLDLPSGTSVRFEPGDVKEVQPDPLRRPAGGVRVQQPWCRGRLDDPFTRETSLKRCVDQKYGHKSSK